MHSLILLAVLAASPEGNVAVFADGVDLAGQASAGRIEVELEQALKKHGVSVAAPGFPAATSPSSADGDKLFAGAKEQYDNLDFDAAIAKLGEAVKWFREHPSASNPKTLSEIFVFLGASQFQQGAKAEAEKAFVNAINLDPAQNPDAKFFGSDVQGAFNAAKTKAGSPAKVTVNSVPSGATVILHDAPLGLTPLEATLPRGTVLVTLNREGFAPSALLPDVTDKPLALEQKLEAIPAAGALHAAALKLIAPQTFNAPALPNGSKEVGATAKAEVLVMMMVSRGAPAPKVSLQAWQLASGNKLKDVSFDFDPEGKGIDAAAQKIATFLTRPDPVAAVPVAAVTADDVQPSAGGSVFKKWWFWAGVGVVAAGAATTVAVVATRPRGPGGFNVAQGLP